MLRDVAEESLEMPKRLEYNSTRIRMSSKHYQSLHVLPIPEC